MPTCAKNKTPKLKANMIKIIGELEDNVSSLDAVEGKEVVGEFETKEDAKWFLLSWVDPSGKPKDFLGNWMKGHFKRVYIG